MREKTELIQTFLRSLNKAKEKGAQLHSEGVQPLKLDKTNPLLRLIDFQSKTSLILPTGFDYFRLFDLLMFDKKETKSLETRWGNIAREHKFSAVNSDEVPNDFIKEELNNPNYIHPVDNKSKKLPVLKHSSRSAQGVESIVNESSLINFGFSSGVASQPDICMSTDILGKSLQKTILQKYSTPMVWYHTDFNEKLFLAQSAYQMGDRTTIKCEQDNLPIGVHAYTKGDKLIITDPDAFITWNFSSLMISDQVSDLLGLYNLGALIVDVGRYELKDKTGKTYNLSDLTDLSKENLTEVLETSLFAIAQECDNKENTQHTLRFERIFRENKENSQEKTSAIQRFIEEFSSQPEIKRAIEASGLGELLETQEKSQKHSPS